jgi:outer membrane protein assembly factor BamB
MGNGQIIEPTSGLRLWPGIILALLVVTMRFVLPAVAPDTTLFGLPLPMLGVIVGLAGSVAVLLWWLLLSRAPWTERLVSLAAIGIALGAIRLVVDRSISNGMMGMMYPVFATPLIATALVAAVVVTRHAASRTRRLVIASAVTLACALMAVVRTGGITGDGNSDLHWRWTSTPEQRLLAAAPEAAGHSLHSAAPAAAPAPAAEPVHPVPRAAPSASAPAAPAPPAPVAPAAPAAPATAAPGAPAVEAPVAAVLDWPGFRGPHRDGIATAVQIDTNWSQRPPKELWRRAIGPGWSSFAVRGDFLYTQEQRGEDELVSCYRVSTGEPVWQHHDAVRFYESNGGAGPRGTPTLDGDRVFTMGATGILNGLDAGTGRVLWSRNAVTDTGKEIPGWGIASSPLVVDDLVIVAVAGQLAAYDAANGQSRWIGETGGGGYSSPQLATIGGVPQVILVRGARTISVAPADGALLWEHRWVPSVSIVQPAISDEGDVVIASGDAMGGLGLRRVSVSRTPVGWNVDERWTSRALKPYFNDFVMHRGHAFGFDGSILACLNLADGERCWKGGRYGHGQLVLLPDQDVLLVLSEDGELALVRAAPDRFQEIARLPALNGKTWNHPVIVGDVLLVRNGEEMAAFRLATAGS